MKSSRPGQPPQEEGGGSRGRTTGMRERGDGDPGGAVAPPETPVHSLIDCVVDDRYRIVSHLGDGGMGAVYLAEHIKLKKRVALKVVHKRLAGSGDVAARFAREASASARVDHPNVASALDFGTLPQGGAYIVMQLVRGRSLEQVMHEEGRLPWQRACAIAAQIADALGAAHAAGIIHRDLKPENVVLERREEDGREIVKVLDFGIARVADDGALPAEAAPARVLTRIGAVMGTPGYMAPEQSIGDRIDHRADLYALGVLLWEMIAGRVLFEGTDLTEIATRQFAEDVPPPSAAANDPSIPHEVDALCASLLSRSPAERPERAGDVRGRLLELAGPEAFRPSRVSTADRPQAVVPMPAEPSLQSMSLPARWSPLTAIAMGLGGLVLVGVVIALVLIGLADERPIMVVGPTGEIVPVDPDELEEEELLPRDVQARLDVVLRSEDQARRREAAEWLQANATDPEIPPFVLAVAEVEAARGCVARARALDRLGELGDARALPLVRRLDALPRRGCGTFNNRDCYSCLRPATARALRALGVE